VPLLITSYSIIWLSNKFINEEAASRSALPNKTMHQPRGKWILQNMKASLHSLSENDEHADRQDLVWFHICLALELI
jgi:hypothetical protein